jgi:3-oxoacyl-[acyl-carrier protein] reductase
LSQTIESIQAFGGAVLAVVADINPPASSRAFANAAFQWHGYVHVWVQAAGADVLTGDGGAMNFDEKLQQLWETDVRSTIRLSRYVASRMQRQPKLKMPSRIRAEPIQEEDVSAGSDGADRILLPSIVHLGWDQADAGMEGDSGQYFSAVKAAVAAFSKSLAKSVAPDVRVNCVMPGWIQTEWGQTASDAWSQRATGESLLGRWGKPPDVARLVAALSMGDGEFVNAQSIAVSGGWTGNAQSARCHHTHDDA